MTIQFDSVYERDMDLLFMRKIAQDKGFVRRFFLWFQDLADKGYDKAEFIVEKAAHSVVTEDGESDIEAVLSIAGTRVALLIEDKIDAMSMRPDTVSGGRKPLSEAIMMIFMCSS